MQANNVDVDEIIANNMAQHGPVQNENLLAVTPVLQEYIDDGHGSTGPLFLIGYLSGQPVYRTTHTVAHHMEGYWPGAYRIHWPPLFPHIWLPECQYMQLDVTIRKNYGSYTPPVESDDDSEYYNQFSIEFGNDNLAEYDEDNDNENDAYDACSDLDVEYPEALESNIGLPDNIEIEWIIVDDSDEE